VPKAKPSPLARILESEPVLAAWKARHLHEAALTAAVRRHLPRPLGDRLVVLSANDGILELAAGAGAIVTSARQRVPGLLAALRREGHDFTEIRLRVQVRTDAGPAPTPARRQWDSSEAASLFALAERLPDGPLKLALLRWVRRARGRS
jgi:hypothetical protein